jgi:hypothetical protein
MAVFELKLQQCHGVEVYTLRCFLMHSYPGMLVSTSLLPTKVHFSGVRDSSNMRRNDSGSKPSSEPPLGTFIGDASRGQLTGPHAHSMLTTNASTDATASHSCAPAIKFMQHSTSSSDRANIPRQMCARCTRRCGKRGSCHSATHPRHSGDPMKLSLCYPLQPMKGLLRSGAAIRVAGAAKVPSELTLQSPP